jgi:hypothetical protein
MALPAAEQATVQVEFRHPAIAGRAGYVERTKEPRAFPAESAGRGRYRNPQLDRLAGVLVSKDQQLADFDHL